MTTAAGRAVGIVIGVVAFNLVVWLWNANNPITRRFYRLRWTFFCSTRSAPAQQSKAFPEQFWAWDVLDPDHLHRGAAGPVLLLLLRLFEIAFFVFTVAWQHEGPSCCSTGVDSYPGKWLTFFTNWTFVGFCAQAVAGAVATSLYLWRERKGSWQPSAGQQGHANSWPGPANGNGTAGEGSSVGGAPEWGAVRGFNWVEKAFVLLLVTFQASSISLTIFYWVSLFKRTDTVYIDNPFRHGGSMCLMFIDILLCQAPFMSWHVQGPILYGSLYLVFMWGHWAREGIWVYKSLDWHKPSSPLFYIAMVVLLVLSTFLLYGLAKLRDCILSRCSCCASRRRVLDGDSESKGPGAGGAAAPPIIGV